MPLTFLCYVHKPGVVTPELRVISCDERVDLPDAISADLPTWGEFDMIDVYDDNDRRLFSFAHSPPLMN